MFRRLTALVAALFCVSAVVAVAQSYPGTSPVPISRGGTGSTNAADARSALGVAPGTGLTTTGSVLNITTVPVANGGTNLTSYTAGDLLYASGATTLSKLGIGTAGQVLTVSGGVPAWAANSPSATGYTLRQITNSTASGTWTKQAWTKAVRVTVVGGGGGGGGGATTTGASGSGGGGGGTCIEFILAASLGATESVTVGAAANGGTAGGNGTAGNSSSFGAHCSAPGGAAGTGVSDTTTITLGGAGGIGSGGDLNIAGSPGGSSAATGNDGRVPGNGGSSTHGGGGAATTNAGGNGGAYGGGGAGGRRTASTNGNGGNGAAGVVIVEEFE